MLQPGTRIRPYEVVSPLGAGGMGEVYRARDTVLGREVALKTLPEDVARQPQRLARLRREARILASLNHPGIATLHGLEERDGAPVIVMEEATFSEVSAAILERDPDFAALPESTPYVLQRLLRRCLRRDQEERLRDLADAALELRELQQEISSGSPVATLGTSGPRSLVRPHGRRRLIAVSTGLFLLVAGGLGLWAVRRPPALPSDARQPRFEATLPRGVSLVDIAYPQNPLALSPDGQRLAFIGCGDAACQIYLRERREIDARPLAGTEGAESPFFSPDGRWIAFGSRGKLKKAALDGSAAPSCSRTRPSSGAGAGATTTPSCSTAGGPGCIESRPQMGRSRRPRSRSRPSGQ